MNPVLGIDFHQEMHMLRHDFQFENLGSRFSTDVLNNLFEPNIDAVDQHGTAILRAPHYVVFARVDNILI